MESSDYKTDKLALAKHNEQVAVRKFQEIEEKCALNSIAFLKANTANLKIRERKNEPNFKILLAICWTKISALAGIKKAVDSFVVEDITKMIYNYFSELTIEEIYKAFEFERYNVYTAKTEHFQEFDANYISTVLKKYKNWKYATQIQHNIATTSKQVNELISDDEKKYIMENAVNRLFSEFKQNGTIEENGTHVFDFLIERGFIKNNNKPEIVSYYDSKIEEAKQQLKTELTEKNSQRIYPDKNFSSDLQKIASGKSNEIIIRAKKNILIEFFKKQVELEKTTIF